MPFLDETLFVKPRYFGLRVMPSLSRALAANFQPGRNREAAGCRGLCRTDAADVWGACRPFSASGGAALNAFGIRTAEGGQWHAAQAIRVRERLEFRWMPSDPADNSRVTEPEPD